MSTTPGVVSKIRFTSVAAASRVLSSAAYTSATSVESTGGPGGISATLAEASYRRAMESIAGRTATAMAWLWRDRSPLGRSVTCTSPTLGPERRK